MSEPTTRYYFIPWLRLGLATQQTGLEAGAPRPKIKASPTLDDLRTTEKDLYLYGPGDVLDFDARIVTRSDPRPNVGDFEPNYFPAIEFAEPDYPWRFTATTADQNGRLTPWITLIVLIAEGKDKEIQEEGKAEKGLPSWIRVKTSSLPDLSQCWRWAHVQVTADGNFTVNSDNLLEIIKKGPGRIVSRLLCARRLRPGTKYHAYVVPTFMLGQCVGLGIEPPSGSDALTLTWGDKKIPGNIDDKGCIRLPYYGYHWEFSTSLRGDFEYLVRLLEQRRLDATSLGTRPINCSAPGCGLTGPDELGLEGALMSLDTKFTPWGKDAPDVIAFETVDTDLKIKDGLIKVSATNATFDWKTSERATSCIYCNVDGKESPVAGGPASTVDHHLEVKDLVPDKSYEFSILSKTDSGKEAQTLLKVKTPSPNMPFQSDLAQWLNKPAKDQEPIVVPPIYGCWPASRDQVDGTGTSNAWLDVLNLDPRHRVAAGLGTKVIQEQQEALMASTWEQLGAIQKANDILRLAQLGRATSTLVHQRLGKLPLGDYLQVLSPMFPRVRFDGPAAAGANKTYTIAQRLPESPIPVAAFDPAFRRISRPGGPLRKRQKRQEPNRKNIVGRLNTRHQTLDLKIAGEHARPNGMISVSDIKLAPPGPLPPKLNIPSLLGTSSAPFRHSISAQDPNGKYGMQLTAESLPAWLRLKKSAEDTAILQGEPPSRNGDYQVRLVVTNKTHPSLKTYLNFTIQVAVSGRRFLGLGRPRSQWTIRDLSVQHTTPAPTRPEPCLVEADITPEKIKQAFGTGFQGLPEQDVLKGLTYSVCQVVDVFFKKPDAQGQTQAPEPIDLDAIQSSLKEQLDPRETITKRARSAITIQGMPQAADGLEPLTAYPEFPQPMYGSLRDISQELILPGVENVPQNSVALLHSSPCFIEAYLCGLNHEFARELLWRECPADLTATYFRQFWDVGDRIPGPDDYNLTDIQQTFLARRLGKTPGELTPEEKLAEHLKDIKPIREWKGNKLGENRNWSANSNQENLVLIVRGDVLKKYPNTVIYAVAAHRKANGSLVPALPEFLDDDEQPADPDFPVFSGEIPSDISFFGFSFGAQEARGDERKENGAGNPGKFFVFEERVSEARFGMDEPKDEKLSPLIGQDNRSWDNLSWGNIPSSSDVDTNNDKHVAPDSYLDSRQPKLEDGKELDPKWDGGSAAIAWITCQKPVRVAIHASQMIPKGLE